MKPERPENPLSNSIKFVKGVGPKLGALFLKKGISTIEDALFFAPREYQDRSRLTKIKELSHGQTATVYGKVVSSRSIKMRGYRQGFEAILKDETGLITLFWFHAYPALKEEFAIGTPFLLFGHVEALGPMPRISHPEYEKAEEKDGKPVPSMNFGRIVPVYSESEGLTQKVIRRVVGTALKSSLVHLNDPLPEATRIRLGLSALRESVLDLHYPNLCPQVGHLPAKASRLVFEEFFSLEMGLNLKKKGKALFRSPALLGSGATLDPFYKTLPFSLTQGQHHAIREICSDMEKREPMTRLLQGDVGSGKTIVALAAAAVAAKNGFQAAIMAPTEILAEQHIKNAQKFLTPLGITFALLSSSAADKKAALGRIASGECQAAIGTHALFQQDVVFSKLGLVVVDEQHRFGVAQRNELLRKNTALVPHLLMMTATPIPRSLALTLYGDLDITTIREKPAGRKPIETKVFYEKNRQKLYEEIAATMGRREQVYVIYPLIEASEKLDLKSATEMYEQFRLELFPGSKVGLLHGRMSSEEKESILNEFRAHRIEILISTTVIEVGIDVANATLMVIEHPERLGLSQLHQLRGRVGRGEKAGRCYLITKMKNPRLQIFTASDDGFQIAEEDLKIRGPGEFMGTRQSGLAGFRLADITRDAEWLERAKEEAERILESDPELRLPENAGIRELVESRWKAKLENLRSG